MQLDSPHISVVSPIYMGEKMLDELVERVTKAVSTITENFEIILVDDCGPDKSWEKISEIAKKNSKVKGLKLSRNFGQHYAITAGLDESRGEYVIVMDCDLQDVPEEIPNLYQKILEGNDIVLARRTERQDNFTKKLFSILFYKVLSYLSGMEFDASVANFGIYKSNVINQLKLMREQIRYFPAFIRWVGFKKTSLNVNHSERVEGKSSYNLKKLINLALDIILSFSEKPMRIIIKIGIYISLFSFLFGIYILVKASLNGFSQQGYASIIFSIWFLSGIIILITGVTGLYIGKIFQAVKNRPIYIISERT